MTRLQLFIAVSILVLGSTSFETHAQSQDDVAKQFVGAWRLISWIERLANGETKQYPSVGYIIYSDTSRMCATIMNPNRAMWRSGTAPTPDEAVSTVGNYTDFIAYCSTVEVHAREGFVLHHVEIERSPNIVGRTRKRWFTFEGLNRLTLRVDAPELAPPTVESTLTWERVVK